jgi:hypothetical protein
MRESFLRALLFAGACAVMLTEILSLWNGLNARTLLLCWIAVIALAVALRGRLFSAADPVRLAWPEWLGIAAISVVALIAGYTALLSPPNSADAMAYHMPRVIYWAQRGSVAFFPAPYLNQIMLQPVAEYFMLHTYLLSGGDRFVNLVQWIGMAGSALAVSSIAEALGLSPRAQIFAALFCVTLPNGILQASGAKNDYLAACWLACAVYFAVRWAANPSRNALAFAGLAIGLALGTKATLYLFAPFVLTGALIASGMAEPRVWLRFGSAVLAATLLIDAPQYARNFDLSGSILGFDSAQADGVYRWRNETLGWRPMVSNLIRNGSEQLGARSAAWNEAVYKTALAMHRVLGIDPQDRTTTWPGEEFKPPKNANHEADANNRWHLLIASVAWIAVWRERRWWLYAGGLAGGFAAFCFYLKWQPFLARLELPLFVLASPLAAAGIAKLRPGVLPAAIGLFLLSVARLPLTENWTRPLVGPKSIRVVPREEMYFNDMTQWNNRQWYLDAADRTARGNCRAAGIDARRNQLEYPLQALLLGRDPSFRFVHVNVENVSRKYARAGDPEPCAVLTLP